MEAGHYGEKLMESYMENEKKINYDNRIFCQKYTQYQKLNSKFTKFWFILPFFVLKFWKYFVNQFEIGAIIDKNFIYLKNLVSFLKYKIVYFFNKTDILLTLSIFKIYI